VSSTLGFGQVNDAWSSINDHELTNGIFLFQAMHHANFQAFCSNEDLGSIHSIVAFSIYFLDLAYLQICHVFVFIL